MPKLKITRDFLASLAFRVMTRADRLGFEGCDSPIPLIAETDDGEHLVVVDGDFCEVYGDPDGDGSFVQVAVCENIRALPIPQY